MKATAWHLFFTWCHLANELNHGTVVNNVAVEIIIWILIDALIASHSVAYILNTQAHTIHSLYFDILTFLSQHTNRYILH